LLVIAAGLWATASLLLRHWKSIEQAAGKQVGGRAAGPTGQHVAVGGGQQV